MLERLCENGPVIMPKLQTNVRQSEDVFKPVGRQSATSFTGLCGEHDRRIFEPIDRLPIDLQDEEHLFLLAYRSVLREVHAVQTGTVKNQLAYQAKVDLGLIPGEVPTGDGERSLWLFMNAYEFDLYKRMFDEAYQASDYQAVHHVTFFEDGFEPTIAVSALFSLDEIQVGDDVARIALNVFPLDTGVACVFSFLSSEMNHISAFLKPFQLASGEALLQLLSVRILQSCENFVLSPRFWNGLAQSKRQAIAGLFLTTILRDGQASQNSDLMLFKRVTEG